MAAQSDTNNSHVGKGLGCLFILLIMAVLVCGIAVIATHYSEVRRPKFAIEPRFDDAYVFSQGLAAVKVGDSATGKWGFIAKQGNMVIKAQFNATDRFAEGLAPVGIGSPEKWGYINTSGQFVIPAQFDYAGLFSGGIAPVRVGDSQTGTWGYIGRNSQFVITPRFSWATSFVDGLAAVCIQNANCGFITTAGEFAVRPQFVWANSFSDGLASVEIDEYSKLTLLGRSKLMIDSKYWYIDKTGHITIPAHADSAKDFHSGFAVAGGGEESQKKFGYINHNGDFVIPTQFDHADDFGDNGLAAVSQKWKVGFH